MKSSTEFNENQGFCVSSCASLTDLAVYPTSSATDPSYCIRKASGFDPKPPKGFYVKTAPTASSAGEVRPCFENCKECADGLTCEKCDASSNFKFLSLSKQCVSSCNEGYPKEPTSSISHDGECKGKLNFKLLSLFKWMQILFKSFKLFYLL